VYVDLYFPSQLSLEDRGFAAQVGGAYPWGGNVTVTVSKWIAGGSGIKSIGVRVPQWAKYGGAAGGVKVLVDGKETT